MMAKGEVSWNDMEAWNNKVCEKIKRKKIIISSLFPYHQ